MAPDVILLTASAAFAAVSFVSWRLNRSVQQLRIEMVTKADILLDKPGLPATVRRLVEDNVRTVFGVRARLLLGVPLIPFMALLYVFRQRAFPALRTDKARLSADDRDLFDEVCDLHDRITLMNHIVLSPLVEAELLVCVLPAVIVRSFLRNQPEEPGSSRIVRDVVEHQRYREVRLTGGVAC